MHQRPAFVLLSLIISLFFVEASAQAVLRGGGLSYRSLDSSSYEVSAQVFVQCTLDTSQVYTPEIECLVGTVPLAFDSMWLESVQDITGIGKSCIIASRCQGDTSTPYGIELRIYKAIFTRTANSACNMLFFLEGGERVSTITTGQANQTFYVDAFLNHCLSGGNAEIQHSTQFDNLTHCHNQDFVMANNMFSPTRSDSLSYSLTNARTSQNTSCTYSGNFSPLRPATFFGFPSQNLNWPAGLHLDPLSGDLMFRPTALNQVSTIAIEVTIWRKINGVNTLVGRIRNEKTIHIISCVGNKTPKLLPPFNRQICAGEKSCITIASDDEDLADTVRINWYSNIPGATFTHNSGTVKHAQGEVCWTPDTNFISNQPYVFTVEAKDDNCPLERKTVRAYSFFVREKPEGTSTIKMLSCGLVAVSSTPKKAYPGLQIYYYAKDSAGNTVESGNGLADTLKLQPGFHQIETRFQTATPCFFSLYDTLTVPYYFKPELSHSDSLCFADSVDLFVTLHDTGTFTSLWTWKSANTTVNLGNKGYMTTIPLQNSQEISVRFTDASGCYNTDSITILTDRVRLPINRHYNVCEGDTLQIGYTQPFSGSFLWDTWDTTPKITVRGNESHWLQIAYPNGCTSTDTITTTPVPLPVVQLPSYLTVCQGSPVQVSLSGLSSSYSFQWFVDSVKYGPNSSNISFIPTQSGTLGVRVTSAQGCFKEGNMPYNVYSIPLNIPTKNYQACFNDSLEIGIDEDIFGLRYTWNTGQTTKKIQVTQQGQYILTTSDPYQCKRTDTFSVLFQNPIISFPDTLVCEGVSDLISPSVQGARPFQYLWSTLSTDSFVIAAPGRLSLLVSDYFGCQTYVEQDIHIAPSPRQSFTDTQVCQGTYLHALEDSDSTFIASFKWQNQAGSLYFNPSLSGIKQLSTITTQGCKDTFTYQIQVNNLPIPAFTWYSEANTFYFTALHTEFQNKYMYSFGDGTFGYFPNSVKTYNQNGSYPVKLLVTDTITGCNASREFIIDAYKLGQDDFLPYSTTVSPNPFSTSIEIKMGESCSLSSSIRIINMLGQCVYESALAPQHSSSLMIDLSGVNLERGIYLLNISCGETLQTIKLVKE